ncbi:hypothetical protein [Massilia sp. GCM10023247]|uniref:hypothetical protein n=1 Tax=Massilia sp. GCM10023247 TaxID=3252643 RepID=UPI003616BCCE
MRPSFAIAFVLSGALAGAPAQLAWAPAAVLATGGGEKGPWRQNDSRYDYVDDATVAFDAHGGLALAWVDQARKEVLFQRFSAADGRPDGKPVDVSRSPATFSWQPRIGAAPGQPDKVCLLWQEIVFSGGSHGGEILFACSDDGGRRFAAPLNLSRSRGGDGKGRLNRTIWSNGSHDLAVAADGSIVAAWTEYDGALWLARSRDAGASFTAPRQVAGSAARPARAPALATAPGGRVYLAWTVGEDPAADIHVAQSTDGGASFGPPLRVAPGAGHADAPRLAVDRDGALHLAYAEAADGPGGRYRIRYTRSPGGIDRFGPPRTVSDAAGRESAAYPGVATDAEGGLYLIWEVLGPGAGRPHALGMTLSRDGGRSFSTPGLVPGSEAAPGAANGSQQGLLGKKLAAGPGGRVAIVNSSLRPDEGSRVWLMRGQARRQAVGPVRQR